MPTKITETKEINISSILIGNRDREELGDILGLAKSIKAVGLINPIIIDKDHNLVAGLRRIEATKLLKKKKIEARFYEELSNYQRRRILIEEEIIHKKSMTWVEEINLKSELHELYIKEHVHENAKREVRKDKPWGQKQTAQSLGIAMSTLSEELRLAKALKYFPELTKIKSKSDAVRKMYRLREFSLLQAIAKKQAESGTTEFAGVNFLHADCLKVLPTLKDESIDLVITDPPWGIELKSLQGARSVDYKMFDDTIKGLYKKVIPELYRVLKDGSHLWLFFGIEHHKQIIRLLEEVGFDVREVPNIWVKEGPSFSNWEYKPMPRYELFFFAVKSEHGAPKQLKEPTSDVFDYKRAKGGEKIHPTEKPIELMKRLITLSSTKDELVLDPFAGSGSVMIASMLLGRRGLGIEIDKDYYDASMVRLQNYSAEKKVENE